MRATDSGNQNIGSACNRRQVLGAAMRNGHGRICCKKQIEHRLADDVGTTNHHGIQARQIAAMNTLDHDHCASRSAWNKCRIQLTCAKLAYIDEMEAIDVLFRRNSLDHTT